MNWLEQFFASLPRFPVVDRSIRRLRVATPLLFGLAAAIMIVGVDGIDPTNVGWCCSGDCATHFLGWCFFRVADWSFPLGMNPDYGLEIGSSIFYSDSIPFAAFLFKLIAAWLPSPFQYLGLWVAAGIVLQAWFAWRLLGEIQGVTSDWLRLSALGLFTFAPPLMIRIGGHTALTSHWLILAALYLYVAPPRLRWVAWPALVLTASLIHSYLFVMVFAIWLAHVICRTLAHAEWLRGLAVEAGLVLGSLMLGLWQAGFFAVGVGPTGGFGLLAMNLLAPINPDIYSHVIKPLAPPFSGFHEGYNFLGLGCLALAPVAVACVLQRPRLSHIDRRYWPLAALLVGLTLFALSNRLAIGTWTLEIPLTERIVAWASVLRSSGRMFWPVFYVIVLCIVALIVKGHRGRVAGCLLAGASVIQVVDTSGGWGAQHAGFEASRSQKCPTPLSSPSWVTLARHYRRLRHVPLVHHADDYAAFARLAASVGIATDSAYLARIDVPRFYATQATQQRAIMSGEFERDTLYVLDRDNARSAARALNHDTDLLTELDGYFVLAPGWKEQASNGDPLPGVFQRDFLPALTIAREVAFGVGGNGLPYLGRGWSAPEPWGVWADQKLSELSLPIESEMQEVRIEFEVGALVAANYPPQDVEVWINGVLASVLQFDLEHNTGWYFIVVPEAAMNGARASHMLQVVFRMLNPRSPKSMGLNADTRDLGMTLHRARLIAR